MKHVLIFLLLAGIINAKAQSPPPPNVVLIITDDQGYGDIGYHGNHHVKTPILDGLAAESIRFTNFYVSPVCAPTRSSLMTGRYSLRTGVRDTYNGGAIMATSEVTIAEMLKQSNYATGIFGKWHLGDNYPSRPIDQGFDESVVHNSGGMGQVGDFTTYFQKERSYFDPVLWHNGNQESYKGYCSDIFTEEAIKFIEQNRDAPFFCYLSFNAPHTPLQVPEEYYEMYKSIDPTSGFEDDGRPFPDMSEKDKEDARRVYAMVSNIDDNVGKVLAKISEKGIAENTIFIFMTDNGPQQRRYVAGLRGLKSSVYRGGIRVPFFVRYPDMWQGNRDIEIAAAHIDILPTLASLCNVQLPQGRKIDGNNLSGIINNKPVDWEKRSFFFNWTRKYPELYNNMSIQKDYYKLVGHTDYNSSIESFELFDLSQDPYELDNLVGSQKEKALSLKTELDEIYTELIKSENLINPPKIIVGSKHENPTFLNRNDASGQRGIWAQEEAFGKWDVHLMEGIYDIRFKFIKTIPGNGRMFIETGPVINQVQNEHDTDIIEMKNVKLPELACELIPFYQVNGKRIFPFWVEMKKIE